jgi:hypothetical protein
MGGIQSSGSTAFPPLLRVARALRAVTERLAQEASEPTDQEPPWGDFEWRIARAVAVMQGASSILCAGLRWKGPLHWQRFLEGQREHVAGRHQRIVALLDRIDSQARHDGISLVALKGVALHRTGIYAAGERPMADIDLLIQEGDLAGTTKVLGNCGFAVSFATWRHRVFESQIKSTPVPAGFGEHIYLPIKIEVHTSIRERLPVSEIDITQFIFRTAAHPGINDYPSAAALMLHLLLHAAGNMRAHALRLIQLHDIMLLATTFGPGDWEELLSVRPNGEGLWWATMPLAMTARYYPAAIPSPVLVRVNANCPRYLRKLSRQKRLADVSWSNIRISAFPGIEWARTPKEALRFVVSRVWPGRVEKLELRHFAANHPGASSIPWYGVSHSARILRWIFSKPPRVQCWIVVRAALEQPL